MISDRYLKNCETSSRIYRRAGWHTDLAKSARWVSHFSFWVVQTYHRTIQGIHICQIARLFKLWARLKLIHTKYIIPLAFVALPCRRGVQPKLVWYAHSFYELRGILNNSHNWGYGWINLWFYAHLLLWRWKDTRTNTILSQDVEVMMELLTGCIT